MHDKHNLQFCSSQFSIEVWMSKQQTVASRTHRNTILLSAATVHCDDWCFVLIMNWSVLNYFSLMCRDGENLMWRLSSLHPVMDLFTQSPSCMCTFSTYFSLVSHDVKINKIMLFVWCHKVDRRVILNLQKKATDSLMMEQVDGQPPPTGIISHQKCHQVK